MRRCALKLCTAHMRVENDDSENQKIKLKWNVMYGWPLIERRFNLLMCLWHFLFALIRNGPNGVLSWLINTRTYVQTLSVSVFDSFARWKNCAAAKSSKLMRINVIQVAIERKRFTFIVTNQTNIHPYTLYTQNNWTQIDYGSLAICDVLC